MQEQLEVIVGGCLDITVHDKLAHVIWYTILSVSEMAQSMTIRKF